MKYLGPLCTEHAAPYGRLFGEVECEDEMATCFKCVKKAKRVKAAREALADLTFGDQEELLNSLGFVWRGLVEEKVNDWEQDHLMVCGDCGEEGKMMVCSKCGVSTQHSIDCHCC